MKIWDELTSKGRLPIGTLQGRGFVDEVELRSHPAQRAMELVITRKVYQMQDTLTSFQQLPAWLQFAKARQGGD